MESIQKKTPHTLQLWIILLIVLLFGVVVGSALPGGLGGSQESAIIKSQGKYVAGTTVLYKSEQAYLCAKPDGSDSYIASIGGLFDEFWSEGYLCKAMKSRKLESGLEVLTTPTPGEVVRIFRDSKILSGPGPAARHYQYQCRGNGNIIGVDHTPPPSPSSTTTSQGVVCDLLQ